MGYVPLLLLFLSAGFVLLLLLLLLLLTSAYCQGRKEKEWPELRQSTGARCAMDASRSFHRPISLTRFPVKLSFLFFLLSGFRDLRPFCCNKKMQPLKLNYCFSAAKCNSFISNFGSCLLLFPLAHNCCLLLRAVN